MNDGRDFALGRQSAFITSNPDGTTATLTRTALPDLRAIVDGVAEHGGLAVFRAHDLVPTAHGPTKCTIDTHRALVDHVAAVNGPKVMPLGTVIRLLNPQAAATEIRSASSSGRPGEK